MTCLEKKARKYVQEKFNDYLLDRHIGIYSSKSNSYSYYSEAMDMLKELFPKTNQDRLEAIWTAKWKKENI